MASQRIRGITIEINADNREFLEAFRKISSTIKDTQTQLKDLDKLLKMDPGNVDLLLQKQQLLNTAIGDVTKRLEAERTELERLSKADQTPEVIREQEALQRQIAADEQELQKLQGELREFGSVGKQQAQEVASAFEEVGGKIADVGQKMTDTGKTLTRNVTAPIVAAGTAAVATAADFDSAMAKVQAVTGSTGDEMDALREKALEMASQTSFTASEAADALYYMGLAGWKSDEMMEGLPAILSLAAASGESLASTSDIVTDALTAFGLGAEDTANFVDVLAAASSNSNTTVAGMGEAFKYVAPLAGAMGYSIEDVSLALGLMANNGIKGSQAGASLRNIITKLAKPSAETAEAMERLGISLEDAEGNVLPLSDVIGQLQTSFGGSEEAAGELQEQIRILDDALEDGTLSQEEYDEALQATMESAYGVEGAEAAKLAAMLGGQRAMASILALVNTSKKDYDKLSGAINGSTGAAKQMADVMLDNLGGQMTILKSQLEGVAIQMGDILIPVISEIVDQISEWVQAFAALDEETKETIIQIAGIVAAAGPALIIAGSVTTAIGNITSGIGGLIGLVAAHPLGAALTVLAGVIGATIVAAELFIDEYNNLTEAEAEVARYARDTAQAYDEARIAREKRNEEITKTYGTYEDEWKRLQNIVTETGKVKQGYEEEARTIIEKLNGALGLNIELKDGQIERYQLLKNEIGDVIQMKQAEALLEANQEDYLTALKEKQEIEKQLATEYSNIAGRKAEIAELENAILKMEREADENGTRVYLKNAELTGRATDRLTGTYLGLKRQLEQANEAQQTNIDTLAELQDSYGKWSSVVQNYETLTQAIEDETISVGDAIKAMTGELLRAGAATEEALREQYEGYTDVLDDMIAASEVKGSQITKAQVAEAAKMVILSAKELDKLGVAYSREAVEAAEAFIRAMEEQEEPVRVSTTKITEESLKGIGSQKEKYGEAGQEAIRTYDQGLLANPRSTYTAGQTRAEAGRSGVESVSYTDAGKTQARAYDESVAADIENTKKAGQTRAQAGRTGAASVDYTQTGKQSGSQYDAGLAEGVEQTKAKGKKRAQAGKQGAEEVSYRSSGQSAAKSYDEGILAEIENTKNAARKLPEAAKGVLEGYSANKQGRDYAEGFARGIESGTQSVLNAAGAMARQAQARAEYVLGIDSPSKVMMGVGRWFDLGFAEGIQRNAEEVASVAGEMAMSAVDATQLMPDVSMGFDGAAAMQGAGAGNTNNYGDISIIVNGAQGQDVSDLADIVMDKLYRAVERKQAVLA